MGVGVQQQLPTMFEAQKPLKKSNPKWKKLTDSICYFLAKDVMPFDTVNDPCSTTEALGAQKYVTISMIRLLLHKLLEGIFKNSEGDSRLTKMMRLKMKENLYDRYTGSILDSLNKAAFLDPRFKMLSFIPDSEKERTIDQIIII